MNRDTKIILKSENCGIEKAQVLKGNIYCNGLMTDLHSQKKELTNLKTVLGTEK